MTAQLEHFWNIGPEHYLIYLFALGFLAFFFWGFGQHYRRWRLGRPETRTGHYIERLRSVYHHALKQNTIREDAYAGVMHLLIFGSIGVLLIGTSLDGADYWLDRLLSLSFLRGPVYLGYSLILDLAGLGLLIGLGLAAYRRYLVRPAQLDNALDDALVLGGLALITVSGFMLEGLRLAATEVRQHADWAAWSPVALVAAWAWLTLPLGEGHLMALHRSLWWAHAALSFSVMGYCFYSKLSHIILGPVNIYLRPFGPRGALAHIPDLATPSNAGVDKIQDFSWKQLFDLDACTGCGRCQQHCPAWVAGTPLSPKGLIQDLKAYWWRQGGTLLSRKNVPSAKPLAGSVVPDEALWACTTCRACHSRCPVMIEFID
jgi:ferredoxin